MRAISRVLVANRGEIAVRIIQACRKLGIQSILAASEADRENLAARLADRVVLIGPPAPKESYLRIGTIVMAAVGTGAEAVHPGYGFLAEQPELAEACTRYGLGFIGPRADQIRKMGDKVFARQMARNLGIPVIAGSEAVGNLEEAVSQAQKLGYPLLLKAAAGGGGKGMKIVRRLEDLKILFTEAGAEALAAFGDSRLYLEQFIPRARHVEIQVLGDRFGRIIHLGDRDCSLQRRYQKMVEETPSPALSPGLRAEICRAALVFAREIQYENAGTVEFLLDPEQNRFFFLEMNTRIQVEHPVTEMVTGMDLVMEQIRIAAGEPLRFTQEEVQNRGHSVECRINAESPHRDFQPCPGRIEKWEPPTGKFIRLDSHCYPGYFVPPYYDSLLGKLVVWGEDRRQAVARMMKALAEFRVSGVDTTIPFHRFILENPDFAAGRIHTHWIEDTLLPEFQNHERNQVR
ncbi:MAG: acetyl-CoA carboxylase biotin carboxylase subunit [Syntrophaceae bacterium]|nr:acetyl-CoA carboxylase biotin carboxylase subunit [Syntrophaceae bacterium]